MRSAIRSASLLLVLSVLIGCAESRATKRTHETVVMDAVSSMKATIDSMNGARDAASGQQAEAVLQRETAHLQQLKDELVALGQPSSDEKKRAQKHSQEMTDASKQITQATAGMMGAIQSYKLPHEVGTRLAAAANKYGKAMEDFGKQAGK